jgi:Bacterial archaeo-eukaryotic release factor family 11
VALHTDIPSRSEVERLLRVRDTPCISIYLQTTPVTQHAQADRIELKNLAADAMGQIEAAGLGRRAAREIRDAFAELVADDDFWAEQAHSLAVFASPAGLWTYRLPNRLGGVVEVADRFYVKPLLRAITFPQAGFVLALAAGSVRLVEMTRDGPVFPVDVPGLPTDAASAAGKASLADRSPIGRIQGSEGQKVRLRQFARKIDQALRGVLTGLDLPLILAAVEPLESIYRSLNTYPHLVATGLPGASPQASDGELAAAARKLLDQVYADELSAILDRFELRSSDGRASTDVATLARAATYGAVETLLVDIDAKVPGHLDDATGAVTLAEDDAASYGVIDEIAGRVLLSGGRVLAVRSPDLPGGPPAAGILRYAI